MTEIQRLEEIIKYMKRKEQFLAELEEVRCPLCGSGLGYKLDISQADFYGYEYNAKGKIFCMGCGCFGKEYESNRNPANGREADALEQFGNLFSTLSTLKRYATINQ